MSGWLASNAFQYSSYLGASAPPYGYHTSRIVARPLVASRVTGVGGGGACRDMVGSSAASPPSGAVVAPPSGAAAVSPPAVGAAAPPPGAGVLPQAARILKSMLRTTNCATRCLTCS